MAFMEQSSYLFAGDSYDTPPDAPKSVWYRLLLKNRLSAAAELLRSTALPVKEIAALSGFRNAIIFTEAFKRFAGVSPRDYRNT